MLMDRYISAVPLQTVQLVHVNHNMHRWIALWSKCIRAADNVMPPLNYSPASYNYTSSVWIRYDETKLYRVSLDFKTSMDR